MASEVADGGFSEDERAAMKARAAELKASARRGSGAAKAAADEQDALDRIAEMPDADRAIGEVLHAVVRATAPDLAPRTWYGMPAYARDGHVVVFFKAAAKFKARYAEVGFTEWAKLDDGEMWPTALAVTTMNPEVERALAALVERAIR